MNLFYVFDFKNNKRISDPLPLAKAYQVAQSLNDSEGKDTNRYGVENASVFES
jgi:hypothetical protein